MNQQEGVSSESPDRSIKEAVLDALRDVIDPELGINIVDLGLVYGVEILNGQVTVRMTMTSPACPLNAYLSEKATAAILSSVHSVKSAKVVFVWDPPWSPEKMSEAARREMGWQK